VEIFSTDTEDGRIYEGSVTADEYGYFSFSKGGALAGPFLTATAWGSGHSTSEFSQPTSARSGIQIALDAVQNDAPLFQTSFDAWDFGNPVENARVENGKLIVSNDSDINTYVSLDNLNFSSKRFAVEFETQLWESLDNVGACQFSIISDDTNSRIHIVPDGYFQVDRPKVPDDLVIGSGQFDPSISNTVMLIVLDDQLTLFINGELAFSRLDPEGSTEYTSGLFEASSQITCEFDNFKFWDLSGVDLNP
jgi:hypothetical protein